MYRPWLTLLVATVLAQPLSAQRLERSHIATRSQNTGEAVPQIRASAVALARDDSTDPIAPMIVSGLLFGAAGMFAGGYLGYAAETSRGCGGDDWFCGVGGAILGGYIGTSFGVSGGIHMAGPRGHSYAGDVAVALGIGALGLVSVPLTNGFSLLAVPVAQLVIGTYREAKLTR